MAALSRQQGTLPSTVKNQTGKQSPSVVLAKGDSKAALNGSIGSGGSSGYSSGSGYGGGSGGG